MKCSMSNMDLLLKPVLSNTEITPDRQRGKALHATRTTKRSRSGKADGELTRTTRDRDSIK
jgi:hypothetical protein